MIEHRWLEPAVVGSVFAPPDETESSEIARHSQSRGCPSVTRWYRSRPMNSRSCSGFADKTGRTAFKNCRGMPPTVWPGPTNSPSTMRDTWCRSSAWAKVAMTQGYRERPLVAPGWGHRTAHQLPISMPFFPALLAKSSTGCSTR